MASRRPLARALLPEALAVVAAAAVATRWPIAALAGLLAVSVVARALRDDDAPLADDGPSPRSGALLGAALGAVALALAVVVVGPAVEAVTARSVEWTEAAAVRGHAALAAAAAALACARALAAELVFRRWLLARAVGVGVAPRVAVALVAAAELALAGGGVGARLGALAWGVGAGWMFVAARARWEVCAALRVAFDVGVVALAWQRVV